MGTTFNNKAFDYPARRGAWENRAMDTPAVQLDEASLAQRLEAQKEFVARLISEGKDASSANALLYELSKALSEMRRKD